MKKHKLSRRSFLARVSGGALTTGALGIVTGQAWARQTRYTDSDPNDPVGAGRGGAGSDVYTGVTDADGGPNADPIGGGRGITQAPGRNRTGLTDSDTGSTADAAGYGMRGGGRSGITDTDSGANADPIGSGRGGGTGPLGQRYTGVTDSDGGQGADAAGYGRGGGTGVTDADQGATADAAGRGRGTQPGGSQHYSGLTDHDTRDRRGYGGNFPVRDSDLSDGTRPPGSPQRNPRSGYTDRDPSDSPGRGTGGRVTGPSDNDSGLFADPVGRGRGTGTYTGITDTDTGTNADRAGYGTGRR